MSDTEPRYTLAEAKRELSKLECVASGHYWEFVGMMNGAITQIRCEQCGWTGSVTMGEKP